MRNKKESELDANIRKITKILLIISAVSFGVMIAAILSGCATDPNHESMDECHTYCCWHGESVTFCDNYKESM